MQTDRCRWSALVAGACLVTLFVAPARADDRSQVRVFERQIESQRAIIAAQRAIIANLQRKLSWQARHPHVRLVSNAPPAHPPSTDRPATAAATAAAMTLATPQVVSRTVREPVAAPPAISLPSYGWGRI